MLRSRTATFASRDDSVSSSFTEVICRPRPLPKREMQTIREQRVRGRSELIDGPAPGDSRHGCHRITCFRSLSLSRVETGGDGDDRESVRGPSDILTRICATNRVRRTSGLFYGFSRLNNFRPAVGLWLDSWHGDPLHRRDDESAISLYLASIHFPSRIA